MGHHAHNPDGSRVSKPVGIGIGERPELAEILDELTVALELAVMDLEHMMAGLTLDSAERLTDAQVAGLALLLARTAEAGMLTLKTYAGSRADAGSPHE